MKRMWEGKREGRRTIASLLLCASLVPAMTPFAAAQTAMGQPANPSLRSSAAKKLVLVGGAALLYYLYKRHQATAATGTMNGRMPAANPTMGNRPPMQASMGNPQLYRSKNGGIYYRDAQKRPVWLTVPAQGAQVPASDLQRYAPDYNSYRGAAPAAPRGYTTQPFSEFDKTLMSVPPPPNSRMNAPSGPAGIRP